MGNKELKEKKEKGKEKWKNGEEKRIPAFLFFSVIIFPFFVIFFFS